MPFVYPRAMFHLQQHRSPVPFKCKPSCSLPRALVSPQSQCVSGLYLSPGQISQLNAAHVDGPPTVKSHTRPLPGLHQPQDVLPGSRKQRQRVGALGSFGNTPRGREGVPSQGSSRSGLPAPPRGALPRAALRPWARRGGDTVLNLNARDQPLR